MQGLRLPVCISSRGSLASTVTAGEIAEAQAPNLRQQLELQIRRGRNCQTTGGRIVRKHCKYRGTHRRCQEGLKTPKTWSATSSTSKTKMPAVCGRGSPTPLKPRPKLPPNQFRVFAESPRKAQCRVRKIQGNYMRWFDITRVL